MLFQSLLLISQTLNPSVIFYNEELAEFSTLANGTRKLKRLAVGLEY